MKNTKRHEGRKGAIEIPTLLCLFVFFVAILPLVGYFSVFSFNASATLMRPSPLVSSCLNCSGVPKNSFRDRSPSLFLSMLVNQDGAVGAAGRVVIARAAGAGDASSSCTCG